MEAFIFENFNKDEYLKEKKGAVELCRGEQL